MSVKPEAEYKAKYVDLFLSRGDADSVPGIIEKLQADHMPQIPTPERFEVLPDYSSLATEINKMQKQPMIVATNMANMIAALHQHYFSTPQNNVRSHSTSSVSSTLVSCGSIWFNLPHEYTFGEIKLAFSEIDRAVRLCHQSTGSAPALIKDTGAWLDGLAFSEMKSDYLHVRLPDFHAPLCALAKNCFAFAQADGQFFVCAKPKMSLDFRLRLHNDNGMAVEYPSGEGFHALRGVRVDGEYLAKPPSGKELMAERNAEVRMVLLEKYGAKLIEDMPHKVVSSNKPKLAWRQKEQDATLIEITWDGYSVIRMLHLRWLTKENHRQETLIHVPATKREFEGIGQKPPSDIDDCEQMRRWVMRLEDGDKIVRET